MSSFFRTHDSGIDLFVRLTPRSSIDAIDSIAITDDGRSHLVARVRAIPEQGAANAALEKLLGRWFGVARSSVVVANGATSRLKTVRISGDAAALSTRLRALGGSLA